MSVEWCFEEGARRFGTNMFDDLRGFRAASDCVKRSCGDLVPLLRTEASEPV